MDCSSSWVRFLSVPIGERLETSRTSQGEPRPTNLMRERIAKTDALILRRRDFGEADRLLLLATPAGKRSVIAKGARKTMSRLAGHIELFTHARMLLAAGRNLDIVTQSQVVQHFPALRTDLHRLGAGYYIAELYDKFTQEEAANPALFQLLVETLHRLNATGNPDVLVRAYELRLLANAGYRPRLHRCAVCQIQLTEEAEHFSPRLGGMLCPADAPADPAALRLQLPTFKLLRYLQTRPLADLERLNVSAAVRAEARDVLRANLVFLLERELKSAAFLDSLGPPDRLAAGDGR